MWAPATKKTAKNRRTKPRCENVISISCLVPIWFFPGTFSLMQVFAALCAINGLGSAATTRLKEQSVARSKKQEIDPPFHCYGNILTEKMCRCRIVAERSSSSSSSSSVVVAAQLRMLLLLLLLRKAQVWFASGSGHETKLSSGWP
jgi:hypothetical protein